MLAGDARTLRDVDWVVTAAPALRRGSMAWAARERLRTTRRPHLRYPSTVPAVDVDLERLSEVCERYGVASLEVFGSVARGDNRPDSDLDLLYVLRPGARLGFKLFDLEDELAALFGRPVDLVGRHAINKYIRAQVLTDAQPLYAA